MTVFCFFHMKKVETFVIVFCAVIKAVMKEPEIVATSRERLAEMPAAETVATSGGVCRESSVGVVCLEGVPREKKILAWEQGDTAAPLMGAGQGLLFLHVGVWLGKGINRGTSWEFGHCKARK